MATRTLPGSGIRIQHGGTAGSTTAAGSGNGSGERGGGGLGGDGSRGLPERDPDSPWMDRSVRVPGSIPNPCGPLASQDFILKDIYDVRGQCRLHASTRGRYSWLGSPRGHVH